MAATALLPSLLGTIKHALNLVCRPPMLPLMQGQIEDAKKLDQVTRTYGVSSKAAEHIDNVQWIKHGRGIGT